MTNYNPLSENFDDWSEEKQIDFVKANGYYIQFIKNPSDAVKLASVKRYGPAIEHINNPSEELQLAAVQQSGLAIKKINNPSVSVIKYCLYECEISNTNVLKSLYEKLTSDEDRIYFKMKYGNIY